MRGLPALISVFATLLLCSARAAARESLQQTGGPAASSAARAVPDVPGLLFARGPAAGTAAAAPAATPSPASSNAALAPEELKQMEASLLALFGLKRRPRPNRARAVVPEAMMELWRRQQGNRDARLALPGRLARPANTVRSFTHVESDVDATFSGHHRFRLAFDVHGIPSTEALKGAELQLSRRASAAAERAAWEAATAAGARHAAAQRVLVHDVVRPGNRERGRDPILRLLDSRVVTAGDNASLALDVYPAVQRWREQPRRNHGLLVEVLSDVSGGGGGSGGGSGAGSAGEMALPRPHVRLRREVGEDDAVWLPVQPVLIAYTDDGKASSSSSNSRSRRAAPAKKHHKAGKRDHCRRYPLYVDFADVGWNDWIVAPPGYDAFYCHGDCPFPLSDHLNSTNHAIVQTLMHSVKPTVPQACCVPTALTSISMLYLDETDKVVLKNYQEMAVLGCGCR